MPNSPNISPLIKYYNNTNPSQSGSNLIENNANWASTQNLDWALYPESIGTYYDVSADEFSFNFLNYSGKFLYAGASKGWVVISDYDIKIEQNGFLTPNEIKQDLQPYINSENSPQNVPEPFQLAETEQSRAFKSFTLITPDGTRYSFGGLGFVEYSTSYYSITNARNVSLNSWYLSKIEDIYGNVVNFNYSKDYITCDIQGGTLINALEVKN
ncbi:MAG: hypothetical protein HC854_03160 [Flavobacterium sp.]|nr:hypothetical protein [Flavobacterium sp.]